MNHLRISRLTLFLLLLLLAACVAITISVCGAQQPATSASAASLQTPPPSIPYSANTYPETVRLQYAEGDVRIQRSEKKNSDWQVATTGLPLYSGFSLVTGADGRAVIELEDASTVYIDSNSVLVLNDMHTTIGVPFTEMALFSGTVALHVHPYVPGELFVLVTPTDTLSSHFPQKTDMRVTAYTNAVATTPLKDTTIRVRGGRWVTEKAGTTLYMSHGVALHPGNANLAGTPAGLTADGSAPGADTDTDTDAGADTFAEFDRWAQEREAVRQQRMSEAMQAFGFKNPLPGLDQLAGQGEFFPCAPYGTCWQPPDVAPNAAPGPQAAGAQAGVPTSGASAPAAQAVQKNGKARSPARRATPFDDTADFFPCMPDAMLYRFGMYPGTGVLPVDWNYGAEPYYAYPWSWAVCHAGAWLYRNHRYTWVGRHRRWHRCPIHWVRNNGKVGFVPMHPRDVAGKLPVNRVHGIYTLSGKLNGKDMPHIVRVEPPPGGKVEMMKDAPKEFRNVFFAPLRPTTEPRMEARRVDTARLDGPHSTLARDVRISFDHKAQGITLARPVNIGGQMRTVTAPLDHSFGGWQGGRSSGAFSGSTSHSGFSGGGGGGFRGSSGGGGGAVHASSGGGGGGGGFHGGGGGGGGMGGGGGHSGGGGGGGGGGGHH